MAELIRSRNIFPPILNCTGGYNGRSLESRLSVEEARKVLNLPVSDNPPDQINFTKAQKCEVKDVEITTKNFPWVSVDRFTNTRETVVGCLCANTDCEFNLTKIQRSFVKETKNDLHFEDYQ